MASSETADAILLSQLNKMGKRARMAQLYCPAQRIISISLVQTHYLALLNAGQSHVACNSETPLEVHVQNWLGSQCAA